jgi:TolB-like protein/DNA-binding winged helix-turn-helix (wHTH) protein
MEATDRTRRTRFDAFDVDMRSGEVRKHGIRLKLHGQPFQVLSLLLEHPGDVVTREELRQKLWPGDTFVDFDTGLNSAVKKLRDVLGDSAEEPRYVETLPRRGYRWLAPVEYDGDISANVPAAVPLNEAAPASKVRRLHAAETSGIAFLCVLALLFALDVGKLRTRLLGSAVPVRIQSVAVLPLENLSHDPEQEYFADGMTEELIMNLGKIGALHVTSRTSVMRYKRTEKSLPQIARELNVDGIVEGTVQRSGDRVRITAQLIDARADQHLWAKSYERDLRDILALQDEVAQAIANELKIELMPHGQARPASSRPVDTRAYEAYLKGRYYSGKRTEKELKKSVEYYEQAIKIDPNYAPAYAGMADAYALLGFRGNLPSNEALSRAKAAALKAVELDDSLAAAHASLAFIAETHEWDWPAAEREYKRALELNPGYAAAHNWYAGYLMYVGRFEEGIAEAKLARDLDPLSLPVNNALAGRFLVAGRIHEALEQLQKTLDMDPHFAPAHQTLGWAYLNMGKHEEAIQEFEQAIQLSGTNDMDQMVDLGFAYAASGKREKARRILAQLKKLHEQGLVPSGSIGILYGALGDKDEAFAWLDKAYAERDPELTYIKVRNRRFEPLRSDPRFQDLLRRMDLPP